MNKTGFDQYITVFSPDGNIYQIEYCMNAIKSCGVLATGARTKEGVVVISQKLVQEKLNDVSETMFLHDISSKVHACVTGRVADGMEMVRKCREEANEYEYDNGYPMECDLLAKRMGDINQVFMQHARSRLLAASVLLYGIDYDVPQLWKIDPSGMALGVRATAVGEKSTEANNKLERIFKDKTFVPDTKEALRILIKTMMAVLGTTISGDDLECGVLSLDGTHKYLSSQELDDLITQVQEEDE